MLFGLNTRSVFLECEKRGDFGWMAFHSTLGYSMSPNKLNRGLMKYSVVYALALLTVVSSTAIDCVFKAKEGVTIDLTPLMNNEQDYRVWDHLQSSVNQT